MYGLVVHFLLIQVLKMANKSHHRKTLVMSLTPSARHGKGYLGYLLDLVLLGCLWSMLRIFAACEA